MSDPRVLDVFKQELSYGMERFFLLSFCLACCWPGLGAKSDLRVVRQWTELDFAFPSEAERSLALASRAYVPGNSVPIDVDVHHRGGGQMSRIFITIPRFDEGRPMTLGTVDERGQVSAYPDYQWNNNQGQNCDGLTSVFRVAVKAITVEVDEFSSGDHKCKRSVGRHEQAGSTFLGE
ncbi:unnamed protein product [Plutella xylostella]|uniref:(diamondback moth) hypothetical protein n=1 Tax=Plutella xylostella TaxID=51655 RepID=A0A8S4D842_PLUXY|nr:unnamed protein product [Plutella xylostella]